MSSLLCQNCRTEIVPGTNFCRSCGAPIDSAEASEMQTAVLDQGGVTPTTQRLEARPTSGAGDPPARSVNDPRAAPLHPVDAYPSRERPAFGRGIVVIAIIVLALIGVGALFVTKRMHRQEAPNRLVNKLNYPGARTIIDLANEDGSGVLQMETTDTIEKVAAWYTTTLKPTKTIRVTSKTLIMKNDNLTATIVSGDAGGTSIVIKQTAR
jgi:hypothetical protein